MSNLKAATCEDGVRGGSSDAKIGVNCFGACFVDVSDRRAEKDAQVSALGIAWTFPQSPGVGGLLHMLLLKV